MLHPEKRACFSSAMPMTEVAIDTGLAARRVMFRCGEQLEAASELGVGRARTTSPS